MAFIYSLLRINLKNSSFDLSLAHCTDLLPPALESFPLVKRGDESRPGDSCLLPAWWPCAAQGTWHHQREFPPVWAQKEVRTAPATCLKRTNHCRCIVKFKCSWRSKFSELQTYHRRPTLLMFLLKSFLQQGMEKAQNYWSKSRKKKQTWIRNRRINPQ